MKCWGQNFHGQLGDGSLFQRNTPVDVIGIAGASDLDLGDRHTCVVLADATVACWGSNLEGQIGKPSSFPVPVQTAVGGAAVPQIAIPLVRLGCWIRGRRSRRLMGSSLGLVGVVRVR